MAFEQRKSAAISAALFACSEPRGGMRVFFNISTFLIEGQATEGLMAASAVFTDVDHFEIELLGLE